MKQLATAALRVRPELPAADTGYRDARTPSSGAIRAALDPVIRVERWKCDATGALALGAVTLAAIGGYTAPTGAREPWAMLAASATGLIAAVALWRWWTLRRAIGVGADTIASAAASWEPEAQFEARSARKSASHAASGRPDP